MFRLRGRRDQEGLEAFTEIKKQYNALLHSHEVYWKQRAKTLWLKEGDINSRFFHATASMRKKKNTIDKLRNNQVLSCIEPNISTQHNQLLLEHFTAMDVKDALFSMHPDKSPGPDGMNPAFYQKYWHIVGHDVTDACLNYITHRALPAGLNDTLIVLIPKKTQPEFLTYMRPIALCNSAFVPGRAITDNILISTEIVHYLKRKKQGKTGIAALKIDMSKAYDRIEWLFLKSMMLRMGFDEDWVTLIMMCVSTVSYKVCRNGEEVGPIVPSQGLRQGDPLSPYLFIICAKGLSSLIQNREKAGLIHGVKVARSAPTVSHLFFADDCFLLFKATHNEARIMKSLLAIYGVASGQHVNYHKSVVSFSANMDEISIRQVCGILEVSATCNHGSYLGLPSLIGRKKSAVFGFIKEKVWERLQGWNKKFLSKAGKEIMLKTFAQSILNYAMNIYLLPLELCKELELMMNAYWWGNTSKQCWKLITNPNSLVARILKARYYPRSSFVDATVGFNPSYTWRSIMAAKHVVVQELAENIAKVKVNCLMVPGQRRWDTDLVADVFNSRDAALILQVPLSTRQVNDRWFWLADPKGEFTVRSCYNLLNSVSNAPNSKVWKFLWGLEVPGKVKHFLWRALKNILPTADNLLSRRVDVSLICPICSAVNESIFHCLVDCVLAKSCWFMSSLGLDGSCFSFVEWMEQIFTQCRKEDCKLVVMVCWRLWLNRNDKVWNGHSSSARSLVNAAGHYLFSWQEAKRKNFITVEEEQEQLGHGSVCWGKPPQGWLKCNVDAGVFSSQSRCSFRGVIRDSGGAFIAAKCQSFPGLFRPREAEALAVREALSWIKNLQLSKIIVEIDCLNVYSALTNPTTSPNGFGLIIADCQIVAQLIGEVRFSFVRRSANVATHNVARVGGSMSDSGEWRSVPPPWLCPMLNVS
ncbi:reverse transcriptase domain-containing protein [Citrus sinensis]|uniref:Reverse transcriptase domain-containing protein n=1 Tax=Citrus sinensis TaxID=2711 RepID=A0ACB8LZ48_CITSI|nr:reverse transcriptase domain-containing protein [Citrus sinensis]